MIYKKIGIIASREDRAIEKKKELISKYQFLDIEQENSRDIDLIIALGGDGLMLHLLHEYQALNVPIYGINFGTVGFLMNSFNEDLLDAISKAKTEILHPLRMKVIDKNKQEYEHLAINEVSLLRQSNQAAKIKIEVNGKTRIETLVSDGVLVSTPAGSTAYNLSVNGPIIPLKADILTITPISPFRPKNWRGALISDKAQIKFEILKSFKRPVSATADFFEVRDVEEVFVKVDKNISFKILFDPNHSLEERIIREQFI